MAILAALLLALASLSGAPDPLLAEMSALEARRGAAIRAGDFETLARLYAPGFQGRTATGEAVDRDALFAIFRRNLGAPVIAESRVDRAVRIDRLVLVSGTLLLYEAGTRRRLGGSTFMHYFYPREGGGWEMLRGVALPFPSPPPPPR